METLLREDLSPEELNYHDECPLVAKIPLLNKRKAEIYDKTLEINRLRAENSKLTSTIRSLEQDKQRLVEELQRTDQNILLQEEKINQFMRIKSDRDLTISELRKQVEWAETENTKLTVRTKEMDKEFFQANTDKHFEILDTRRQLDSVGKENEKQKQKVFDLEVTISRLQTELEKCLLLIHEPKLLKNKVCELHRRYAQPGYKVDARSFDEHRKFIQHTKVVENSVAIMKRELARERASHKTTTSNFMKENSLLMEEVNKLRKQLNTQQTGTQSGQNEKKPVVERSAQVQAPKKPLLKEQNFVLPLAQAKRLEERPSRTKSLPLPSITPSKS